MKYHESKSNKHICHYIMGDTKPYKEELKAWGAKWDKSRFGWKLVCTESDPVLDTIRTFPKVHIIRGVEYKVKTILSRG